jgi:large subunit ribosomal protein L19
LKSILQHQSAAHVKKRPEVRPGYTIRVHERIQEGNKERIQVFEGLVIAVHKGSMPTDSTVTVRRIASGIGVEKVFLLHSPKIEKIEVKKVAKIRRAKLFFLRGRRGKAARLSERFTTADEFAIAAAEEVQEEASEEAIEEAVVENAKKEEGEAKTEDAAEPEKEAPKEEEVKEEKEKVSEEKKEA